MNAAQQTAKQLSSVTFFEFRNILKSWRFITPLAITLGIFAMAFITGSDAARAHEYDPVEFLRAMVGSSALLLGIYAAVSSSDSLSSEYDKKTGLVLFTKPVSKYTIYSGKLLSRYLLGLIIISIYYVLAYLSCILICSHAPVTLGFSFLLSLLYLFAAISITMFFSSISPKSMVATMLSFMTLVVLTLFIQSITISSFEPWYSFSYSSGAIENIVSDRCTIFTLNGAGSYSTNEYIPETVISTIVMGIYGVFSTLFSAVFFRYRTL